MNITLLLESVGSWTFGKCLFLTQKSDNIFKMQKNFQ